MKDADLEIAVNDSGFPMQIGLKHLVEKYAARWQVYLSEHPWHDPASGADKFLDLALKTGGDQILIVECKRSRDTEWIFLREPTGATPSNDRRISRAWITALRPGTNTSNVLVDGWCAVAVNPGSPIAQYCSIRKSKKRDTTLLETTAAELVRAAEAVAQQNFEIYRQQNKQLSCEYVPVIVTTARLFVCDLDPTKFDPDAGEIPDGEFTEFGMVRFEKSFSQATAYSQVANLEDLRAMSDRSVLVVQSRYFLDFLRDWQLDVPDRGIALALWGR